MIHSLHPFKEYFRMNIIAYIAHLGFHLSKALYLSINSETVWIKSKCPAFTCLSSTGTMHALLMDLHLDTSEIPNPSRYTAKNQMAQCHGMPLVIFPTGKPLSFPQIELLRNTLLVLLLPRSVFLQERKMCFCAGTTPLPPTTQKKECRNITSCSQDVVEVSLEEPTDQYKKKACKRCYKDADIFLFPSPVIVPIDGRED